MSKKSMMKARARLKKVKAQLAAFQRRSRKEAARASAAMKRHQRAVKVATRRYASARKTA